MITSWVKAPFLKATLILKRALEGSYVRNWQEVPKENIVLRADVIYDPGAADYFPSPVGLPQLGGFGGIRGSTCYKPVS